MTDTEAEIIQTFLDERKAVKEFTALAEIIETFLFNEGSNLSKRRYDLLRRQQEHFKKYDTLCEKTMHFIKQLQEHGKETDEYVEIGGLKLRKKPLEIDVNDWNNFNGDVFISTEWGNYLDEEEKLLFINRKVLDDPAHPMHEVVKEAIKKL